MNSEVYYNALLSEAAYANLVDVGNPDLLRTALVNLNGVVDEDKGFSPTQAADFVTHWRVAHHLPNTSTGFSATVFESIDNPGRYVFAVRGTEPTAQWGTDITLTDIADIGADGIALYQAIDLYNYYLQLTTPAGELTPQYEVYEGTLIPPEGTDYVVTGLQYRYLRTIDPVQGLGVIPYDSGPIDVTGHSLGGHLALILSRLDPNRVGEVYTFNAPGFDTGLIGSDDTDWFFRAMAQIEMNETGMTTVGAFPIGRIDNLVAMHDSISDIGNLPGNITPFANEGDGWLSAHAMRNVSDVLAVCNLFAALDPTADLTDDLTPIFMATTNADDLPLTLETMTRALSSLLSIQAQMPRDDRDALYRAIQAIESEIYVDRTVGNPQVKPAYQNLEVVSLPNLTRTETVNRADNDIAYRYALAHLNPFAITGSESLYDDHNQNDELELYDPITQTGEITQAYLESRSAFLALLNQGNVTGEPVPGEDVEFYDVVRDIDAHYDNYLQPPHRIYFGGDEGEALSGMSNHDRLFGGGGDDTLNGNTGDDYLEGNAGIDKLDGGIGNDELHGGSGDDARIHNAGLYGSAGDDALYGEAGHDTLDGGAGRDLLVGGLGQDHLIGGDGIDNLYGDNRYFDQANNRYVLVDDGVSDRLEGGLGDDLYYAGAGDVINDADGLGSVCMNITTGSGEQSYVMLGLNLIRQTGSSNVYEEYNPSCDATIRYTVNGNGTLTVSELGGGFNTITIENFSDRRLGINVGEEYNMPNWRSRAHVSYWFDWYWHAEYNPGDEYDVWWPRAVNLFDDAVKLESSLIPITWERVLDDDDIYIVRGDDRDNEMTGSDETDRMHGGRGDDLLTGAAGDDWLNGGEGNDDLEGGEGQDTLEGDYGDDLLRGGPGEGDLLDGGVGNDIYLFGAGDGNTLINNFDAMHESQDTLRFLPGIEPDDVRVGRAGDDLLLTVGSGAEVIRVLGYFLDGGESPYVLDRIEFANGAVWDVAQVIELLRPSGDADDHIEGTVGDDALDGRGGHDLVQGGEGNDTLSGGEGNDELHGDAGDDEILGNAGDDRLYGGAGDDRLRGGAGRDELSGGGGNDTYLYDLGDEDIVIRNQDSREGRHDVIRFLEGIAPTDVVVRRFIFGLVLDIAGRENAITVANFFDNDGQSGDSLDAILFDDGTEWNLDHILAQVQVATAGDDRLYGYAGNDSLDGLQGNDYLVGYAGDDLLMGGEGHDSLLGGAGNDTLRGESMDGGASADTYLYGLGDGHVHIGNWGSQSPNQDRLRFLEGIAPEDVMVKRGSNNLYLYIGDEGQVSIEGFFAIDDGAVSNTNCLAEVVFQNGTRWNAETLHQYAQQVTEAGEELHGGTGDDSLDGLGGDDHLYGYGGDDRLTGGEGDDGLAGGDGNDTLLGDEGDDFLSGGDGADLLQGGMGNDYLTGWRGNDTLDGGDGDDDLYGGDGNDTLRGGIGGNDHLSGGAGDDTYLFAAGDGDIWIRGDDTGANRNDRLVMLNTTPDSVLATRSGDSLILTLSTTGETVGVRNYFEDEVTGYHALIAIAFDDGTVWDFEYVKAAVQQATEGADRLYAYDGGDILDGLGGNDTLRGAAGNDQLSGNDGNDTLSGGDGNDVLAGGDGSDVLYGGPGDDQLSGGLGDNDYLRGGSGSDTYLFSVGDGNTTINNYDNTTNSGQDRLLITGAAPSEVTATRSGGDVLLTMQSSGEVITLDRFFYLNGENYRVVEFIEFSDGTVWDIDTVRTLVQTGSESNDILLAYNGVGDTLDGMGGNDTLLGANGDDHLSGGIGDDELLGAAGNDVLDGGVGNDQLSGEEGDDQLAGGEGNDTINGNEGDDLLIAGPGSDTLIGSYGNDIYRLAPGDGNNVINNQDWSGAESHDKIEFDIGITPDSVALTRSGYDLVIEYAGSVTSITGFFQTDEHSRIDSLQFHDGTQWTYDDVRAMLLQGNDTGQVLTGYETADLIDGGAGNDTISGADGNDQLMGGTGNDTLDGGNGNDLLDGGVGDDTLAGWQGNDELIGGAGDDRLSGSHGDDRYVFQTGHGQDTIDDLLGNNTIVFSDLPSTDVQVRRDGDNLVISNPNNTDRVTVIGQFNGADSVNVSIHEISFSDGVVLNAAELLSHIALGTPGDDAIQGNDSAETINGLAGNDDIFAYGGDDRATGGAGDDYLIGNAGDDLLLGGNDNDFLFGQDGNDYLQGGAGNDFLFGSQYIPNHYQITDPREYITYDNYGWDTWNQSLWVRDTQAGYDVLLGGEGSDVLVGTGELYGGAGGDRLLGSGVLYGGMGDDLIIARSVDDWTYETGNNAYESYYTEYGDNDTIVGGRGNDVLQGKGRVSYLFNRGDGLDTIENLPHSENEFSVRFGATVAVSDLSFVRQGNDMVVRYGGVNDQITVSGWFTLDSFSGTYPGKIDRFEFSDGAVITSDEAESGLGDTSDPAGGDEAQQPLGEDQTLVGDEGYNVLTGGTGNDVLDGQGGIDHLRGFGGDDTLRDGAGNGTMRGGEGGDAYLYGLGDGGCFILNEDGDGGVDVLRFLEGISPEDVILTRDRTNLQLTIHGETITVVGQFQNDGRNDYALDAVEFADGASWNREEILARLTLGTAQADVLYGDSTGDALDGLGGNDNIFGAGGDDSLTGGEGGDRLFGQDGQDTLAGDAGDDTLMGGSGGDSLSGGSGNDTLFGGLGDDTLQGGAGNDDYRYSLGDGADLIDTTGGGIDSLSFLDVSAERLSFSQDGDDLVVFVDGDIGQSVRVTNHFLGGDAAIDAVRPSDGAEIPAADISTMLTPLPVPDNGSGDNTTPDTGGDSSTDTTPPDSGSDTTDTVTLPPPGGDDSLIGTDADETLITGVGNDTLSGGLGNDRLLGGEGDDSYIYTGGQDTLEETAGIERLRFENGITFGQVASSLLKSGDDLVLRVNGGPDQITLRNFFLGGDHLVETIEFATGGALTAEQIFGAFGLAMPAETSDFVQTIDGTSASDGALSGGDQADLIAGYNGDDALVGGAGEDRLEGGNGADTLTGGAGNDQLVGGRGNDTYIFNAGDGQDTIDNLGGGLDTLRFEGIDFNQVASGLMRSGNNLILRVSGGSDQVTLQDYFKGGDQAVDRIVFASGGELTSAQLFGVFGVTDPDPAGSPNYSGLPDERNYGTITLGGAGNDNYLAGSDADFIDAGAGDDLLDGGVGNDYLIGGYGSDTYLVGAASGHDIINNHDADDTGSDTLRFETAAIEELWFSREGNDLMITQAGTDDRVTLAHWYDLPANEVDRIEAAGSVLLNNQVDQLVAAMASYDVPSGVGNVIPQNVQDDLQPFLAENWQAIA